MTSRPTLRKRHALPLSLALITAAVLAACGGGGDSADLDSLQARPQTLRVSL
jgi:hypothetical protein